MLPDKVQPPMDESGGQEDEPAERDLIDALVASAPKMTTEQAEKLRRLFAPL